MIFNKRQTVNIIGYQDDSDRVLRNLVKSEYVQFIDARKEIEKRVDILKEAKDIIKIYTNNNNLIEDTKRKLDAIIKILDMKLVLPKNQKVEEYDFNKDIEKINEIYREILDKNNALLKLKNELEDLKKLKEYLTVSKDVSENIDSLINMNYIRFKAGKLIKYSMDKMKKNYENIAAIIFKVYENKDEAFLFILIPEVMELEVNRVLNSLNFEEYKFEMGSAKCFKEYLEALKNRIEILNNNIMSLNDELLVIKEKLYKDIIKYKLHLNIEMQMEKIKSNVIMINNFFIIAASISKGKKKAVESLLEPFNERLIVNYCNN
ncbi:hypothetical protein FDN13_04550 [Caloramator sp. E03]|uniref:hypothetical protein n=1 Tax=Caloramator sp. E03 TaxID=2576307 RepID=UPI00111043ED|nr:hypothetical protein [Caloramator sp. E03]QCX33038.1 hypothetical protein FDN13_04550 [Caloramator sp. E03]